MNNTETPTRTNCVNKAITPLGLWVACTLLLILCVWRFGSNIPMRDDYRLILEIEELVSPTDYLSYIFVQKDQHFEPITILLQIILYRITDGNLLYAMYISVALSSLTALGLILGTWRIRKQPTLTDAIFPLLILSPASIINHTFFLVACRTPTALLMAVIPTVMVICALTRDKRILNACIFTIPLLPTMGSIGVTMAPGCLLFLLANILRTELQKRQRLTALASALVLTVLCFVYFFSYDSPDTDYSKTMLEKMMVGLDFWTGAFGPLGLAQPFSTFIRLFFAVIVGFIVLALGLAHLQHRLTRTQLLQVVSALIASATLGVFIAEFRRGIQPYYIFSAIVLSLTLYSTTLTSRYDRYLNLARYIMFILASMNFGYAYHYGSGYPRDHKNRAAEFTGAIESGTPLLELASRFRSMETVSLSEESFRRELSALKDLKRWPFSEISTDSKWSYESIDLDDLLTQNLNFFEGNLHVTGEQPLIQFNLPSENAICAMEIVLQPQLSAGLVSASLIARHEENGFSRMTEHENSTFYRHGKDEPRAITIWFDAGPSEVHLELLNLKRDSKILSIDLISLARPKLLP